MYAFQMFVQKRIPRVGEMDDMKVQSFEKPTIAVCGDAHGQ